MRIHFIFRQVLIYLFSLSNLIFAQAPDLGRASSFSLFTSIGAFSNLGASNVNGDIGTNSGAFSGFPAGTLMGEIHVVDSISNLVAIDVNAAYNSMLPLTCDSVLGNVLGSMQSLSPNIYCIGSATSLSGNLILDAGGNPDAIFVFKIDGAFSVSSFSTITLINDASLCNVYWQINGAVSLGENSNFVGALLVSGAFEMLESATLQGKGLVKEGAISLHNNLVFSCNPAPVILPITLLSFEVNKINSSEQVNVTWETSSEINSDYFLVEKSSNGTSFSTLIKLNAAGNSSENLSYVFEDENLFLGNNFYRLNQVDLDGVSRYSEIKLVDFSPNNSNVSISPNPFLTSISIDMNKEKIDDNSKFCLYDVLGNLITQLKIEQHVSLLETQNYPKGIYFYTISNQDGVFQSGKLISQE